MLEKFKKPHPFIFNAYSIVIPSTITFLIIVFLAPLTFQDFEIGLRALIALFISIVVASSIYFSIKILKKLFPSAMSEDKWTVGKEFLLVLFVLAIITVLISIPLLFLQNDSLSFTSTILKTSAKTIAISALPILVLILFEQYRHQKLQLKKANDLTDSLKNQTAEPIIKNEANKIQEKNLLINSETNDVELQLNLKDFIYAKSDGNYIEIYFLNSNEIQKKLIRNRLKNIETLLPKTKFLRCHNSFIVNGNAIVKIEGNARNLELHLKDVSETIPVSRAKASIISEFLKNLR